MHSYFNSYYRQLVSRGRERQSVGGFLLQTLAILFILMALMVVTRAAGNLDPAFHVDGKVAKAIGAGTDRGYAMVVQPDGKTIVAGTTFGPAFTDVALFRFNSDGTNDGEFNFGQPVIKSFSTQNDVAYAVALQADGKILIAGYTTVGANGKFLVARFDASGAVDTTFGDNGQAVISFTATTDVAQGITTQMVGGEEKIVVVGSAGSVGDFAVARLNANGTPDNNFGVEGKVTTNINGSTDVARDVVIQPVNGVDKIAVAGYSRFDLGGGSFNEDIAVVRYNTDGSLDNTFDADGKVVTNISSVDQGSAIVTQPVAGVHKLVVGGFSTSASRTQFTLVRYNVNGSLDLEFNGGGK